MAAPTLSELIRRLERELGTPLFTRTTRRVALTSAGAELLARSKIILDEVAAAGAAVRRVAGGEAGARRRQARLEAEGVAFHGRAADPARRVGWIELRGRLAEVRQRPTA